MFRKIVKPVQTIFTSLVNKSSLNFSSVKGANNPLKSDSKLLFPFDQNNTIQALKEAHLYSQSIPYDLRQFIKEKKLNSTPFSQTYRVSDPNTSNTLCLKTIDLASEKSFEQVNLILRQFASQNTSLAQIIKVDFNDKVNEVNILSENPEILVSDYVEEKRKAQASWKGEELNFISWQLLNQLNTFDQLSGIVCSEAIAINPQNLMFDKQNNLFKLYDFSDFRLNHKKVYNPYQVFLDSLLLSLVRMIDPLTSVRNSEQARAFISEKCPEFLYYLETIDFKLRGLGSDQFGQFHQSLENEIHKNLLESKLFEEKENQNGSSIPHEKSQETETLKVNEALYHLGKALEAAENSKLIDKNKMAKLLTDLEGILKEVNTEKQNKNKQSNPQEATDKRQTEKMEEIIPDRAELKNCVSNQSLYYSSYTRMFLMKIWEAFNLKNVFVGSLLLTGGIWASFALFFVLGWLAEMLERPIETVDKETTVAAPLPIEEKPEIKKSEKSSIFKTVGPYIWVPLIFSVFV